jgi:cell division protein FtsB
VDYTDFRARREATVWQRWNRVLLTLLLLAVWLVIVSLFVPPYKKLQIGHDEIDKLQQQRDDQQALLAKQTREVNLLKTDPVYLETIARDRLDLMKDGETIFRVESAATQRVREAIIWGAHAPRVLTPVRLGPMAPRHRELFLLSSCVPEKNFARAPKCAREARALPRRVSVMLHFELRSFVLVSTFGFRISDLERRCFASLNMTKWRFRVLSPHAYRNHR